MSLQVWLPLTGSLENKGLADVAFFENHGATIDNSGKIGKCYYFDNSGSQYIVGWNITIPQNSFTAACWFYPMAYGNEGHNYILSMNELSADNFLFSLCLKAGKPTVRIIGTSYSIDDVVVLNKWYHMVATYDGSVMKMYLNGDLVKTENVIVTTPSTANRVLIAMRSGGYGFFNGKVNDCRIYDNVLSVKEIKELSKAMVTHCKLDNPVGVVGDNIILNSLPLPIPGSWHNENKFEYTVKDGYDCIHFIGELNVTKNALPEYTTNDGLSFTPQANQIVAFSADVLFENVVEGTTNYYLTLYSSGETIDGTWRTTTLVARHPAYRTDRTLDPALLNGKGWTRVWFVGQYADAEFSAVAPCLYARDFTGDAYFKNIKFEIGSSPTDWTPAPTDPLYSGLGYSELLACGSGSPRHRTYTSFNLTDVCAASDRIFETDSLNNEFTVSYWLREQAATSSENERIYYGIVVTYIQYTARTMRISYVLANDDLSYDENQVIDLDYIPPVGVWTMIAFTFKDGVLRMYVNGEYYGIKDRSSNGHFLHGQKKYNPTIGESLIGDVSDLRCYITALSADDIKELYQTTCSIDRNGNLHAYDICEDDNGIKVLGNGAVEALEFDETENLFDINEFDVNHVIPSGSNLGRIALQLSPNTDYFVRTTLPTAQDGTKRNMFTWAGDTTAVTPTVEDNGVSISENRIITTSSNGLLSVGLYRSNMEGGYIPYTKVLDGTYYVSVIPASYIDHTSFRKSGSVAATSLIEN